MVWQRDLLLSSVLLIQWILNYVGDLEIEPMKFFLSPYFSEKAYVISFWAIEEIEKNYRKNPNPNIFEV
eukprot:snap_masked-scaffold_49-processed-gene-1.33-mRNA-1 protein AED:0.88 eAED:1.00 QI:0/0/0/0.33/1/1/3/0/68